MTASTYYMLSVRTLNILFACIISLAPAQAAEVSGTVSVDYQGLFEVDSSVQSYPISVALFPGQGQRPPLRRARVQQIDIVENRMRPAFLSIQTGDKVTFVNHDPVFHQLFSLSPSEPIAIQLGKARGQHNASVTIRPDRPGTTHVFCRIHNKSYARIDVLETPYLEMIQPGERFHFSGISPGQWRLRLASPAAETYWVDVTAVTAPPEQRFTLVSRRGGAGYSGLARQAGVKDLYQE